MSVIGMKWEHKSLLLHLIIPDTKTRAVTKCLAYPFYSEFCRRQRWLQKAFNHSVLDTGKQGSERKKSITRPKLEGNWSKTTFLFWTLQPRGS